VAVDVFDYEMKSGWLPKDIRRRNTHSCILEPSGWCRWRGEGLLDGVGVRTSTARLSGIKGSGMLTGCLIRVECNTIMGCLPVWSTIFLLSSSPSVN
jgi:hypothetical protein